MRIDLNSAGISGSQAEKTSPARPTQATTAASADKTQFSENEISAGKLAAAVLNSPEVRAERVQSLQSQLASGGYQVSPTQVAASIFEQLRVRTP